MPNDSPDTPPIPPQDSPKQRLHRAIQDQVGEDGLVVGWMCIVEISDGTDKGLTQVSGAGIDGDGDIPVWQQIGMAQSISSILEDYLLASYGAVPEDEDE